MAALQGGWGVCSVLGSACGRGAGCARGMHGAAAALHILKGLQPLSFLAHFMPRGLLVSRWKGSAFVAGQGLQKFNTFF